MPDEAVLALWTAPSSDTEQEKQERTERMIRDAINEHTGFAGCSLSTYAKGSYANNTNVKADSDVDIAVECIEVEYWEEEQAGLHTVSFPYRGTWTPEKLRSELGSALNAKFPGQIDATGSTAFKIHSGSARVDADVVPCFTYRYYMVSGERQGTKIFTTSGAAIVNYPAQQLENGRAKNERTGRDFKKAVRILKRVENAMCTKNIHRPVPSYFVECLGYNCPDHVFAASTWSETIRTMLLHIWNGLQGDLEPSDASLRWSEVNECFYLFHPGQKWTRADGRDFASAAWDYLGYS
jgi:hypothetical protein